MENFLKIGKTALYFRLFKWFFVALLLSIFLAFFVVLAMGNIFVSIIAFMLPLLVAFLLSFVEYGNLGYKIEANSIAFRKGIFSLRTLTIPFVRITNVSFHQSLFQRLLSVGNILIDQEDSESKWADFDKLTAKKIIKEISIKSNIQPISK